MSLAMQKNIGAFIESVLAGITINVTAGAGNNASVITGTNIDLLAYGGPKSCVVTFPFTATCASGSTLSLAAYLQSTADVTNGPWVNVATMAAEVVETGITGGAAQSLTVDFDVDLSGAKRYIHVCYVPTCSRAGTDTVNIYPPILTLAGQAELPDATTPSYSA